MSKPIAHRELATLLTGALVNWPDARPVDSMRVFTPSPVSSEGRWSWWFKKVRVRHDGWLVQLSPGGTVAREQHIGTYRVERVAMRGRFLEVFFEERTRLSIPGTCSITISGPDPAAGTDVVRRWCCFESRRFELSVPE